MKIGIKNPALCFIVAIFALFGMLTTKAGAEELPEYVQNSGLGVDVFNIEADNYKVFADSENGYVELGDLDGENRQFSVVGNDYSIDGILADGVTKGGAIWVSEGQTLLLNNISNFTNFENSVINEKGTLQIADVKFTNNSSNSIYSGVINSSEGTVTIDLSSFNDNASVSSGAIESDNNILTITNSSFSNNSATDNLLGAGGAISSNKDDLTINNVNFANNQAKTIGGAIYSNNSTINIDASSFSENTATENGGAIYIINGTEDTPVTIAGTTFEGNKAGVDGGAIFAKDSKSIAINNSDFINNSTEDGDGGAIALTNSSLTLENVNFKGNSAVGNALGGAIFAAESNLTIAESAFGGAHEGEGNSAVNGGAIFSRNNKLNISDTDFTGNNSTENGGAIYIINGTEDTPVTITDSTFNGNKAGVDGGAIFVANTNNVAINNSDFINNSTENGLGGAIASMNGTLTLDNVLFKGNSTAGDLGFGGAIGATESTLTITNSAFGGAEEGAGNTATENGGAIDLDNSELNIENTNFTKNSANGFGGAINSSDSTININNANFIENSVNNYGGAIYSTNSELEINNTGFTGNRAKNGGAVNLTGSNLTIRDSAFTENISTVQGGALSLLNTPVMITGTNFTGNSSEQFGGGAIYVSNSNNSTIKNSDFVNNTANAGSGGAIYSGNSTINLDNVNFKGNTAGLGGAINASLSTVTITNSAFGGAEEGAGNTATENGGAVHSTDSILNIDNVAFAGNNATKNGGAVYILQEDDDIIPITILNSSFTNNSAGENGGALYIEENEKLSPVIISGTNFENNNTYINGGAIYVSSASNMNIDNATFINNRSENGVGGAIAAEGSLLVIKDATFGGAEEEKGNSAINGGAIYANDTILSTENTKFMGNTATESGGAIYIINGSENVPVTFAGTTFEGNKADVNGGAIYVTDTANVTINNNSQFVNNIAGGGFGGAIAANNSSLTINDITFTGNSAILNNTDPDVAFGGEGGAIYTSGENSILTLANSTFKNNNASTQGGAIFLEDALGVNTISNSKFGGADENDANEAIWGGAIAMDNSSLSIDKGTFKNNKAQAGGAINVDDSYLSISNYSTFDSNKADDLGGAICLSNEAVVSISKSVFVNNSAINGGAIYAEGGSTLDLTDDSFIGNNFNGSTAENVGGAAIYATDSDVMISAVNDHVVFYRNNATGTIDGEGSGIKIERGNLTLNANQDKQVAIYDEVLLADNSNLNINNPSELPDVTNAGTVFFSNKLAVDGTMTLSGGMTKLYDKAENNLSVGTLGFNGGDLDLRNGVANNLNIRGLNLSANSNLYVDLDLTNKSMDNLNGANGNVTYVDGKLTVAELNLISDAVRNRTKIKFTDDENLKDNVVYTGATTLDSLSGLYKYDVKYLVNSGDFQYDVSWFHPVLYGSSVAMQGAYLTQVANYETALGNLDQKMLKTQAQRNALKYGNKYAAIDETQVYSPLFIPEENKGVWFRPYANFEDVKLDNGPKVKNQMYGSLIGGDTDLYTYSNGWDAQYSVYVGYNGSHQKYAGNNIYQNGGNLGLTGAFFKGNFFEGLTLNVGMSNAEIKTTIEGTNDLGILSTGIASKTGYNWELANGKFIIQPSFTMSYSFIAPLDDYTLDSGVRMKNKNMNAIQLAPQLKFIGNIGDGWQPYASCRMAWNLIDDAKVKTDEIFLPETTVKPYFEYGVGLQKTIGERFSGFGQAMLRAGGRIGAGFTLGFRWALGDLNDKHQ